MAMTGVWAVKPRGHRFIGHLVPPQVKGQGCMTCPSLYIIPPSKANLELCRLLFLTAERYSYSYILQVFSTHVFEYWPTLYCIVRGCSFLAVITYKWFTSL